MEQCNDCKPLLLPTQQDMIKSGRFVFQKGVRHVTLYDPDSIDLGQITCATLTLFKAAQCLLLFKVT